MEKHQIKNEAGLPIEFDDHYFMRDFYDDMSPLQVVLKAPQIGATVAELVKTFWCAKKKGWDIIYTLPTQSDVHDMAGGKVNRIVAQNPILMEWVKDHDTVEQKSVGSNIIYYRGTFTNKAAMMVSSDLNVHDEVDASDASVIQQYETRLQAKADGRRWYFSHPSLSGYGVDIYWEQSDKKEWFIKCNHCNKEQQLKWPDNINKSTRMYQCAICLNQLSDVCRKYGTWKSTSKGIFSGYHISQLMCSWITADKILTDYETKDQQYFYNYVLGLPYVGSENKISADTVLKNCIPEINTQEDRVIIGLDTGLPLYYVCGNSKGIFYYGKCKAPTDVYDPYQDIEKLLNRWSNSILIADQGGDLIGVRKLQAKYPGRVFLVWYRRDKTGNDIIHYGEGKDYGTITVDRNRMIQLMIEQLRDVGRIRFNGTKQEWEQLAIQFNNIYRTIKLTGLGTYEYKWERNGPDHWVHALVYCLVGLDKYADSMAVITELGMLEDLQVGKMFDNSYNMTNSWDSLI